MLKTISILAIAGFVLALAPAAQAYTLADNWTGAHRIIFNTMATTSQDITQAQADTFVDTDAKDTASTQIKDLGLTWTSVTSFIGEDDARNNTDTTGSGSNIQIYTPHNSGIFRLIATSYDDLWDGSILFTIQQGDGTEGGNGSPWTGTSGTGTQDLPLGDLIGNKRVGNIYEPTSAAWIRAGEEDPNNSNSMYGISEVIPEPATMSLLAIGGIALIRRRRRA
jgi:hypothetical protein